MKEKEIKEGLEKENKRNVGSDKKIYKRRFF